MWNTSQDVLNTLVVCILVRVDCCIQCTWNVRVGENGASCNNGSSSIQLCVICITVLLVDLTHIVGDTEVYRHTAGYNFKRRHRNIWPKTCKLCIFTFFNKYKLWWNMLNVCLHVDISRTYTYCDMELMPRF